jgi:hypothetical protein
VPGSYEHGNEPSGVTHVRVLLGYLAIIGVFQKRVCSMKIFIYNKIKYSSKLNPSSDDATRPHHVIMKTGLYRNKLILRHRHMYQLFREHKFTPLQSPYALYLNKYNITKTQFFFMASPRNRRGLNTLLTPQYVNTALLGNGFQTP